MTPTLAWVALVVSGLVDVAWALAMKKADGFANPAWSAISLVLLAIFVYLLTKALQVLPVGTAYAVWTGIGAAGTVIAGIVLFSEPASAARIFFIATVVAGITGLKMTS
ncbi:MAG TPA: multidrug efflux SMR transporter [Hyphomicrobiaceae bacterium]|nr:multidrug efflux SMR transporter [Hyphomicrobiaceae bacterium]